MLSQTKEPLRVQEHLNKCFEGIKSLNFETKNLLVKGMYSSHGEYIAFDKVVDPYGYEEPVQEDDKKKKKKKGEEDSPRPQLAN
jgi:dynein heavy chain